MILLYAQKKESRFFLLSYKDICESNSQCEILSVPLGQSTIVEISQPTNVGTANIEI